MVTLTPGQAPTASVTDLTTDKTTSLPRGSVLIRGQVVAVNVPGRLLPSTGLDPSQYRFNYWPKDGDPGLDAHRQLRPRVQRRPGRDDP